MTSQSSRPLSSREAPRFGQDAKAPSVRSLAAALRLAVDSHPERLQDTRNRLGQVDADDTSVANRWPTRLISISTVCERLGRSKAWVWDVLMPKAAKSPPPHPFTFLPAPIRTSRIEFVESEFEEWLQGVITRSREAPHASIEAPGSKARRAKREMTGGDA